MKKISVLGSTGSIGTQTLDVADITNEYKIETLTAHRNVALMEEQIRKYTPKAVCMTDEEAAGLPPMKHCKKTRWHNGAFDLIPASGGKAAGILEVLKHYGIDPKDTISFGDAQNDLDMLQTTGISVAMGNGADNVKALASYVTTDVDHDGVYNALAHFGIL